VQGADARILIVEDHKLFAEVIRSTLEGLGMHVLEVVHSADHALNTAIREQPDLVLLDLGLPDEDGLVVGKKIIDACPDSKVVAVTALSDSRAVTEAIRLGFAGYVTKDTPVTQFVSSVRAVLNGQVVMPAKLAKAAAGGRSKEEQEAALLATQLTDRERELLTLLVQGLNSKEIAVRLSISPNTVRTHVQSILTKLQVHSRLEAAAFAVRFGLVKTPGERRPS
jgi:two-component system, NarL family, nitrate/nitrite response regulator NarL